MKIKLGLLALITSAHLAAFEVADLETEHLYLRKVVPADVQDIARIALNPEVTKLTGMFSPMKTVEEVAAFTSKVLIGENGQPSQYPLVWAVVDKQQQGVIGIIAFVAYSERHARGEIGYAFNQEFWGKGYATQAAQAVIAYALQQGALRIYATVDPENGASERVLQKIAMTYEGLMRSYMIINNKRVDRKLYALIAAL